MSSLLTLSLKHLNFIFLTFTILLMPISVCADIRRPAASTNPTVVTIDVYVLDIDEVDTASQSFDASIFVEMSWQDDRLKHQGESAIVRSSVEIWSPRVPIVNLQRSWKTFDDSFMVNPDGRVVYTQRYWGSFSQPLRLKSFPFDTQNFNVQLVAIDYSPEELHFVSGKFNGIADELSVADWTITEFSISNEPFAISSSSTTLASFTATIEAERNSGYFHVKVILPLIFIVMMSWVVFWIDPRESSTQISVAVTSMLTMIAYRFAVGADMPKISYLTRLDFFILGGTILVFTSLIEVLLTSTYAKIGQVERAQRIDNWARILFPVAFIALAIQSLGGFF